MIEIAKDFTLIVFAIAIAIEIWLINQVSAIELAVYAINLTGKSDREAVIEIRGDGNAAFTLVTCHHIERIVNAGRPVDALGQERIAIKLSIPARVLSERSKRSREAVCMGMSRARA